jgi:hypothetical protein
MCHQRGGVKPKMKWQADWLLAREENEKAKVLTVLTASLLAYYSYFGIYTLFVF